MNKTKRFLGLFLVVFMLLAFVPLQALASTTDEIAPVGSDAQATEVASATDETQSAKVNGTGYATLAEALEAAKALTGDVTVEIYDKVILNSSISGSFDSITFVGKDADAEIYLDVQGYITATGKKVAFEDLILSKSVGGFIDNAGFMNVAFGVYDVVSVNYTNCTFANGAYASSGDVTFTKCTFYRSHDKYGLWAYGDTNAVVDSCVFNDYRGIKMYAEGAAKTTDLTVKNTNFSAVSDKPAIVLTYGESVTLEGNTYSSTGTFELDLDGAPNGVAVTSDVAPTCKNDNGACGVLVDGKIYTTVAQAAAVAESGSTVTLLHASTETVELAEGVTLDKNGYTADGVTVVAPAPQAGYVYAYVGETTIWGETWSNAKVSHVFKFYNGDTLMGTATLNPELYNFTGDQAPTWHINFNKLGGNDEWWIQNWIVAPTVDNFPTKVVLCVDGVDASEGVVRFNGPDDLNKIYAFANDGSGLKAYTTLAAAINASADGQINVVRDVTESIAAIENVTLKTTVAGGVTITNTYDDYTDFNNVTLGSGVTLNAPYIYSTGSDSVNVIEGTLNVGTTYYHSGNAKTTIQNGGKVTTGGMTVVRYNTDADAGIYIYGDGDDSTVEFSCANTIGTYSGTFYVKDAVVEANQMWLDFNKSESNKEDAKYAQLNATFENSTVNVTAELKLYEDASLTLVNSDVTAKDVQIRANATPVVSVDENSTVSATMVTNLAGATLNAVLGENGVVSFKKFVAQIGNVGYATLAEALAAVKENGGTLTLLADAEESMTFNYPAEGAILEITIDLNGFTVTSAESTLWVSDGYIVTVKDSVGTGKIISTNTGGEAIAINRNGHVILESGYIYNDFCAVWLYNANENGTFVMNGGTLEVPNGGQALSVGAGKATINGGKILCNKVPNGGGWNTLVYANGALEITGGEFLGTIGTNGGPISISGGTFSYPDDPNDGFRNEHLADGYSTKVNADGSITVYALPTSLQGSGTEEDPFLINNIDDLKFFRDSVNNGTRYNGQFVKLNADIDLNDEEWTPIGDRNVDQGSFLGTFDGGNHTIFNLWISEWTKTGAGFFSKVGLQSEYVSGTVKNLIFKNVTITSSQSYVGVIAQAPSGALIDNVHVTGDIAISGYGYVGGIVGHGYPTINNCSVIGNSPEDKGTITANYWGAGAILGFSGDYGSKVNNATVKNVEIHGNYGGAASVTGSPYGAAVNGANVSDVTITSNSDYCMGYVAAGGTVSNVTISNVTATASGAPITPADAVAAIGENVYFTLAEAIAALKDGDTLTIFAGTYSEGTIKFPASLKNVTIVGESGATLKDMTLMASDGSNISYEYITFNGIVFENTNLLFSGQRASAVFNNWTITNCVFNNVERGNAAISFNLNASEAMENFTFTNNVINGVTGGSYSGLVLRAAKGDIVISGNDISNVAWNAIQLINTTADTLTITGNTFASSADEGILNLYNVQANTLTIKTNKFLVSEGQPGVCYITAADVSENYWGGNAPANLPEGVTYTSYYADAELTQLITISYVAQVGDVKYESLEEAIAAVQAGDTIVLIDNVAGDFVVNEGQSIIIDLNGYDIVGSNHAITNNGTLVINDTVGTGNVYTTDVSAQGRATIVNNGTITINGGWFGDSNNDTTDRNAINRGNAIKNYGTATINGGYFTNVSNQYIGSDAYAYAINTLAGGTTTINNATVYGDINGLIFSDGKTIVNDGSFTLGRPNEENNLWYLAYGDVEIKGGTWTRAFAVPSWNTGDPTFEGAVKVSGGTFNVNVKEQYCAEGCGAIKDLDGNYVVGVKPTAGVNANGPTTIPGGEYSIYDGSFKVTQEGDPDMPLSFVMQFLADQDAEDMASSPYAKWYADFVITFTGIENGSFTADNCYLAGHYGSFGWVKVPVDGMEIEEGVRYPVMLGVGLPISYEEVCTSVKDFMCALYLTPEILEANPDLQVKLELAVVENSDDVAESASALVNQTSGLTVNEHQYEAEDFVVNYVAQIGDNKFTSIQAAINAAVEGDVIVLLGDVTVDATLEISADKSFTLDLAGYNITAGNDDVNLIINGKLTIEDSVGGGVSTFRNHKVYGELVLENGTIQNISTLEAGFAVLLYGGKFTLNDGTVQSVNTSNYAISSFEVDGNAEIVINGGIINGKRGCLAVECGTYAIVNGGEFNVTDAIGGHCVYVTDATIEINDGIFYPYSTNACSSYAVLAYNAAASVTINGGIFNASAPASNVYASAGAITIGGGEFALEPISTYLKEGYAAIKDLDGNYVVGVKPTATVDNKGSMVIPGGEYGVWNGSSYTGTSTENMPLSFVMQFVADQTAADMKNSPYADWYADFVITFTGLENESFVADGCYLAGFYGDFGWVKVPVDGMEIEEGVRYPVMLGVGLGQKYDYVCSGVQDFKCALYLTPEILAANPNIQVNLELAVVDNSKGSDAACGALIDGETTYKVVDYNYDAEDFVVVAQVGNKTYATLQEAFAAAQDGETVVLLADVELDASIKITEGNVTFDLNGNKLTGPDVPATQSYYAFIVDGGSLTLKDSVGGGEIWAKCYGIETKSGSFTMESGIITATNNKTLGTAIVNYGGTVIINGGTLSGALGSVYTDGYFANADTTIYGGTFNGYVTVGDSNQSYSETVTSASNDYTVYPDYKWVEQDGVYVLTAKVYVAAIGEAKYESLQEAIDAANGETVVLLAPITVNKGEELVIDLKGQTVTYSVTATITKSVAMITNKGTLTIKDSVGDGKLSLAYTGASFGYGVGLYTISNEGGTLNIAGGTIENLATVSGSMYDAIDNNSTIGNTVLNISGGNIYCSYIAIRQFANSTTYTNTVNVTDGTINGGNCAIWTQNPGSKQPLADIAISGGKFTGRILLGESSGFDVAISGGTYDRAVAEEFCAEGYIPVDNGDGTYGVKEVSNVEWYQVSMTYGSDLKMNFYLKTDSLVEGLKYYAKVTKTHADGCTDAAQTYYIPMADDTWLTNGAYKQIVVDNIVAKEMNCTISMQIFVGEEPAEGEAESGVAVSAEVGTSVVNYALYLIREYNGANAVAVKTFAVDMLNYGAAAQEFLHHYDKEHLANADLTEDEKALATQTIDTSKAQVSVAGDPTYAEKVTAEFENTIYLNFYFNKLTDIEGYDKGLVTAFVEYVDHYGNTKTINYTNDMLVLSENGQQVKVSVQTLAPADANQAVNCVLYYDGEALTGISANLMSYCEWGLTSSDVAWATLCDKVIRYSQSAYNYFHANTISDNT